MSDNLRRVLSVFGFLLMAAGIVGLFETHAILSPNPLVIAVQIASVGLMVWARLTFGARSFHAVANTTAGGLVTSGPYRYLRHPIYASICYFTWACVFGHLSTMSVTLGVVVLAGAALREMMEEHFLFAQYPEYAAYAARTKRLIPYVV